MLVGFADRGGAETGHGGYVIFSGIGSGEGGEMRLDMKRREEREGEGKGEERKRKGEERKGERLIEREIDELLLYCIVSQSKIRNLRSG